MAIKANIIEGIYFKVGGAAGQTNGLAWSIVEDMGYHLQELIKMLAKYNLIDADAPKLSAFDIELFDFQKSSAVPAFRLTPTRPELIPVIGAQQETVAVQIDTLLSLAHSGNYEQYFKQFELPEVAHDIADEVYKFRTAVGKSPMHVVKPIQRNVVENIYDVREFTKDQVQKLLPSKKTKKDQEEAKEVLGLIRKVGRRNKILHLYEANDTALSFAPSSIVTLKKVYYLNYPLLCQVIKEEDHWVIQHEMMDIYATGETINEAEFDFYNEFEEAYNFYKNTGDEDLSERLLNAKQIMLAYIKTINDN